MSIERGRPAQPDWGFADVSVLGKRERVLKEAGLPTAAVGSITKPEVAEEILQKGQATLIFLARATSA